MRVEKQSKLQPPSKTSEYYGLYVNVLWNLPGTDNSCDFKHSEYTIDITLVSKAESDSTCTHTKIKPQRNPLSQLQKP